MPIILQFVIPALLAAAWTWWVASRNWQPANQARATWLGLLAAFAFAVPPQALAFKSGSVEFPGALLPFIVLMTGLAVWHPQQVIAILSKRALQLGTLIAGFYFSFPNWSDPTKFLYILFGTLAVVATAWAAGKVSTQAHGRGILFWATIFAFAPALIFAQLNMANTEVAGAIALALGSAAIIGLWRGNHFFAHGHHLIPASALAWLLINAQLRFDWYSIDAAWETHGVTWTPLAIPVAALIWWALWQRQTSFVNSSLRFATGVAVLVLSAALALGTYFTGGEDDSGSDSSPSYDYGSFGS